MKFIDLFAGIGEARIAFEKEGFECVFSAEPNTKYRDIYEDNFGERPFKDISNINTDDIPPFDILVSKYIIYPPRYYHEKTRIRKEFIEKEQEIMYKLWEIIHDRNPKMVVLEGFNGLFTCKLDNGITVIKKLENLGYKVECKDLNAIDFGLPIYKKKVFIVAKNKQYHNNNFDFTDLKTSIDKACLRDVLDRNGVFDFTDINECMLFDNAKADNCGRIRVGIVKEYNENIEIDKHPRRWGMIYSVDGSLADINIFSNPYIFIPEEDMVRRLTVDEWYRIKGFPEEFKKSRIKSTNIRDFFTARCIPMIQSIAKVIKRNEINKKGDKFMPESIYRTKEEVLARGREAIGVPFKDIDKSDKLKEVKGGAGKMIEEDWFGIKNNNVAAPDFAEVGIELKVTPYFNNSKGRRAKERLVCNIINYETENLDEFYKSSYWKKNETTLLMSYHDIIPEINAERKKEKKASLSDEEKYELKKQFTIDEVALFKIPEKDLKIIKNDWMIIANKIRDNKAHEISESDTRYLAACTKGSTAEKSLRRQRDANAVKARERAYSLKPSYMTYILNSYIYGEEIDENIIKDYENIDSVDLESYIRNNLKPYFGKSQAEMKKELGIESNAKSLNQLLVSKALSVSDIENSSEFKKADIKVKTIRVECDGNNIEQHMSFPSVKFMDLINEEWEESSTKENMIDKTYMFVIFKKDEMYNEDRNNSKYTQEHLFLNNIMFWQISETDAVEVKKVWEKAREVIRYGAGLRKEARKNGFIMKNDLPKSKDNRVAHMRPHTSESGYTEDSPYADALPSGEYMTKQCFWFNRKFILEQIRNKIL